jgi:nucleotide-binding universal stress UspA family protein
MYKKILVPLDGSELAECVLPHVETIVKGGGVRTVVFARVAQPFELTPVRGEPAFTKQEVEEIDAKSKVVAKGYLDKLVGGLDYGKVDVKSEVLFGKAAESLADYANNNEIDLIIAASHGRSGISRWVLGSVTDRILRSACVPVMLVRAPGCEPKT